MPPLIGKIVYFIETGTKEPKVIHKGKVWQYNTLRQEYYVFNFNTGKHEWLSCWEMYNNYHKARFVLKTTNRWKGMGL